MGEPLSKLLGGTGFVSINEAGEINVYVDGSYRSGNYGWGFAAYQAGRFIYSACGKGTNADAAKLHNVAGELKATMEAVRWAKENGISHINILHDYTGIAAWATGSWRAKNAITQAYVKYMKPRMYMVSFKKVAGHTGVEGNELADKLAKSGLEQ